MGGDELGDRIRDAAMDTFRRWGGQWNVTSKPPGLDDVPADRWLIKVRSHPIVSGLVRTETIKAYLADSEDADAVAAWESELRPIFDAATARAP